MKSSAGRNKEHKKKPYAKPEIKQVPLRPEEAVLASCKTNQSGGPMSANCVGQGHCVGGGS
ncbi:MAG: hypothetical protein MUP41_08370 [Desulfobacterales bacterium]|nr:hypothetical protein [Desulfobacterales bacterium]